MKLLSMSNRSEILETKRKDKKIFSIYLNESIVTKIWDLKGIFIGSSFLNYVLPN